MPRYVHEETLPFPRSDVFAWHMRPGALERLVPPFFPCRVAGREGGMQDGGTVRISVGKPPAAISWTVQHTEFEEGRLFVDEQVSGPFRSFVHRHEFKDDGPNATILRDDVSWRAAGGRVAGQLTREGVSRQFRRLFRFRAERLRHDLWRHASYGGRRLTVAITGASGLVGSALDLFLRTGGHTVLPLVRRKPNRELGEVYWDPVEGRIESDRLEGIDALVHLAGESIASGRWTPRRKKAIRESRVHATQLVAKTVNELDAPPEVVVCASAIGYYGNRGSEILDERSLPGKGFLADLCRDWEREATAAGYCGARVVTLRVGMALSGAGGALGAMLIPFGLGVGGRLGSGRQYVSWIDHDDLVALIHHAIVTPSLRGPVNATAPYPVPNAEFASALGRALKRPSLLPMPSIAVKALLGEMGEALLLDGARVKPAQALKSKFEFAKPGLEESLAFQLGRDPA